MILVTPLGGGYFPKLYKISARFAAVASTLMRTSDSGLYYGISHVSGVNET